MLTKFLPEKFLLLLASPYIAGKDWHEALAVGQKMYNENQFSGTLDILGEEANSVEQCQFYTQMYMSLVDVISKNPLPVSENRRQPTITFKPSTFCVSSFPGAQPGRQHLDDAFDRIVQVVDYGKKHNILMTLEAEDHRWTDFQLETYFALLKAGYNNLGTVLQTRLFRTAQDIKKFDHNSRVRLVIGIYEEGPRIAYQTKEEMKERLISYSAELLKKGAYVELATHDVRFIEKFFANVVLPYGIQPEQFENQFLLGVPRLALQKDLTSGLYFKRLKLKANTIDQQPHLERLINSGSLVRLYLPFGADEIAAPYCKRRLEHNPNLFVYGIKNIFGIH